MRYSQIRKMDISNGEGVGCSLFVQGCHFHCRDCFNSSTWDFDGGYEFTDDDRRKLLVEIGKDYITRFSVLGGEPLCDENVKTILDLLLQIRKQYQSKQIWVYTGYTIDEILNPENRDYYSYLRKMVLSVADVVVDGRFERDKKDFKLKFRGSANQRLIDINKTMKNTNIILLDY